MKLDKDTREINGLVVRQRKPSGVGPFQLILLLHGWTGDEDAMWVFAPRLPEDAYLVAPRGPYKTPLGGYGWHENKKKIWAWVDDFQPAIEILLDLLKAENFPDADLSRFHTVGFSQGAACSYALSLQYPKFIGRLAGLSGFLPEGADALARNRPLLEKQIFIAHGARDELVPVEKARRAAAVLKEAGASVIYCEDDVGHKLSANCFNGLQSFFSHKDRY